MLRCDYDTAVTAILTCEEETVMPSQNGLALALKSDVRAPRIKAADEVFESDNVYLRKNFRLKPLDC